MIIVMGGPHYPLLGEDRERLWRERFAGVVDFYIEGEAKVAFADLIIMLTDGRGDEVRSVIPGLHSLDARGCLHLPPAGRRLADLSEVPSAYLAGLMDPFFDGALVSTVQTNRGCPFSCTFCAEGTRYFSKVAKKNSHRVATELHYIGQRMAETLADGQGRNELLITDSNFGMFPEDLATCDVIAQCQDTYGWPRYVNVTTGKNRRGRVLEAVRRTRGAITLSGAVQSLDEEVLDHVRRSNISADQLMEVALAAAEQGTSTYSEVILGLPGDSKAKHFASLDRLIGAGFGRLNMFQLSLLPGSELCNEQAREHFGMNTRWRVIPRCVGRYHVLEHPVLAAEIDEICVQLPQLPYEDYRACRKMNLLIAAAYNDSPLAAVVKALRGHGESVFGWLGWMDRLPAGPCLTQVINDFLADTDDQLWSDRDELINFVSTHMDRYLDGTLGNNLIYTSRVRILTEALDDLAELALRAAQEVLAKHRAQDDPDIDAFLTEAVEYHRLQLTDVLTRSARTTMTQPAKFDIDAFLQAPEPVPVTNLALPPPMTRRFWLEPEQIETVNIYLDKFGDTAAGAGRLLSKVHLGDLVRRTELTGAPSPHPAPT